MNQENLSSLSGYEKEASTSSPVDTIFLPEEEKDATPPAAVVLEELKHILDSEFFRTSSRGKQFLSYVVRYRLEGHPEPLKERMIGAALFHRPLDYATGDDSVVRAQAREVRRRLDKYYMAYPTGHKLRIDLPTGSYVPEFRLETSRQESPSPATTSLAPHPPIIEANASIAPPQAPPQPHKNRLWLILAATTILLCISASLAWMYQSHHRGSQSALMRFWVPTLSSSKPVLICLPKPVLYRPSAALYKRTEKYPGEFDREVYRMNHRPHLAAGDKITWGDISEYWEYGVSRGDVLAAVRLSNFLGRENKDNEVRIGDGYTSEDLRNSPAIVIGAYSNPWSIDMTNKLHYFFADDAKGMRIQEQGAHGNSWPDSHTLPGVEYGLVTRLLDSSTGQVVIIIAGITASGSDAAADLVTNQSSFNKVLAKAPADWAQKNMEIVVSTEVKNSVAGPANVVSAYFW